MKKTTHPINLRQERTVHLIEHPALRRHHGRADLSDAAAACGVRKHLAKPLSGCTRQSG